MPLLIQDLSAPVVAAPDAYLAALDDLDAIRARQRHVPALASLYDVAADVAMGTLAASFDYGEPVLVPEAAL